MFGRRETHLLVLRDLERAQEAVHEALSEAGDEERPGLRRALHILADLRDNGPEPRLQWASQVLERAAVDPAEREVHAVKAVREALPGLSLAAAVQLVRETRAAREAGTLSG